jgi:hypothetical protein
VLQLQLKLQPLRCRLLLLLALLPLLLLVGQLLDRVVHRSTVRHVRERL